MYSFDLLLAVLTVFFILILGSYLVSILENSFTTQISSKDKQTKLLLISNKLIRRDLVIRDSFTYYPNTINPNKISEKLSTGFMSYYNLSYFSISLNSDDLNEFSIGTKDSGDVFCIRRIVLITTSTEFETRRVGYADICLQ